MLADATGVISTSTEVTIDLPLPDSQSEISHTIEAVLSGTSRTISGRSRCHPMHLCIRVLEADNHHLAHLSPISFFTLWPRSISAARTALLTDRLRISALTYNQANREHTPKPLCSHTPIFLRRYSASLSPFGSWRRSRAFEAAAK